MSARGSLGPRVKLRSVCSIVAGQSPSSSAYNGNGNGLPFYQGKKEFTDRYLAAPSVWTTETTKRALSGDIVMSVRAPVGPVNEVLEDICIGRGLAAIRAGDGIERGFLWYALLWMQPRITGSDGAVFPSISRAQIEELEIPLPPTNEQKLIVAALDQAFATLDRARALAEANLADARELFDNTLSENFSLQRQGWAEAAIGDCIRFIDYRGRTPDKTTSGLRLITAKNVKKGYLQDEPREFVAEDSYSGWMTRGIPVQGDVLFTTEAPLGNVAQLDTNDKVVFAQRIIIMQADANRIDSTFLKYMLLSSPVQKRIHAKATGATALGIKASLLKTIKISFPEDITEQRGIVEKIDMLQEETKRLEALYVSKLTDLANLRQSLLQKAFSGRL